MAPQWRSGGDYIRRGLRENKEDGRLMIVSGDYSGLQRVICRTIYTEGYIKICTPWIGTSKESLVSGDLSGLQKVIQNYDTL